MSWLFSFQQFVQNNFAQKDIFEYKAKKGLEDSKFLEKYFPTLIVKFLKTFSPVCFAYNSCASNKDTDSIRPDNEMTRGDWSLDLSSKDLIDLIDNLSFDKFYLL